jgi:hypothetical protein
MSAALMYIMGNPATSIVLPTALQRSGPSMAAQLIVRPLAAHDRPLRLVERNHWISSDVAPEFQLIYLKFTTYLSLCQNAVQMLI